MVKHMNDTGLDSLDIALSQVENLFRFTVDHSSVGSFILDDQFRIIYLNKELCKIMGYTEEEVMGHDFREYVIEEYRDVIAERYLRRQRGEDVADRYEAHVRQKDGTPKILEVFVAVKKTVARRMLTIVQLSDITEQKRIETELQQSRKKYHDIFENVLDLIFIHDLDGYIRESNAHFVTELGWRRGYLVGKHLKDIVLESHHNEVDSYMERIGKKGRDQGLISIVVPDGGGLAGEVRILEYKNFLVYDEHGAPQEVQGSARDLTEHFRAKKALAVSEERYRTIIQNMEDIYFEVDLAGRLLFFNGAMLGKLGYAVSDLQDMPYDRYIVAEDMDRVRRYFSETFMAGNTGRFISYRVRDKDGSVIHFETIATVVRDDQGKTVLFRGIARDVTERKRAERMLKDSEQQFREIIQGTPIPTFVINESHRVTHWNEACEKLTGVMAVNVVNTRLQWQPFYSEPCPTLADLVIGKNPEKDIEAHYSKETVRSQIVKDAFEVEAFFPGFGKQGKWLLLTAAPLTNSRGQITGAIETLQDTTEKKMSEAKLLRMHNVLEEKVKERTLGLEEANVALKVLLKKRESDRRQLEEQMVVNIREIVSPYIERLKNTSSREMRNMLIETIERNLTDITSPLMKDLSVRYRKLTPAEIQIIDLIKHNKTTKEISGLLNISPRTVETHRDNIRKKLGIRNRKVNLKSYLSVPGEMAG